MPKTNWCEIIDKFHDVTILSSDHCHRNHHIWSYLRLSAWAHAYAHENFNSPGGLSGGGGFRGDSRWVRNVLEIIICTHTGDLVRAWHRNHDACSHFTLTVILIHELSLWRMHDFLSQQALKVLNGFWMRCTCVRIIIFSRKPQQIISTFT